MKTDIYQRITQQVITNLQKASSWKKLWDVPQPVSLNGHYYTGINYLLLSTSEHNSPVWGTYQQVRKNGGTVKKGEKSSLVVFWKRSTYQKENLNTGEMEEKDSFLLRFYLVFNSQQCVFDKEGKQRVNSMSRTSESARNERSVTADNIIDQMEDRPRILLGLHGTPCYLPTLDEIRMPDIKYFHNRDAFYAALFHELIHSTGHKKRLNRFEANHFDNKVTYSKEELVAELGSAYLSVIAELNHNMENTQAYIKGWLQVLQSNPSWIVWAASRAQKACGFILPTEVPEEVNRA